MDSQGKKLPALPFSRPPRNPRPEYKFIHPKLLKDQSKLDQRQPPGNQENHSPAQEQQSSCIEKHPAPQRILTKLYKDHSQLNPRRSLGNQASVQERSSHAQRLSIAPVQRSGQLLKQDKPSQQPIQTSKQHASRLKTVLDPIHSGDALRHQLNPSNDVPEIRGAPPQDPNTRLRRAQGGNAPAQPSKLSADAQCPAKDSLVSGGQSGSPRPGHVNYKVKLTRPETVDDFALYFPDIEVDLLRHSDELREIQDMIAVPDEPFVPPAFDRLSESLPRVPSLAPEKTSPLRDETFEELMSQIEKFELSAELQGFVDALPAVGIDSDMVERHIAQIEKARRQSQKDTSTQTGPLPIPRTNQATQTAGFNSGVRPAPAFDKQAASVGEVTKRSLSYHEHASKRRKVDRNDPETTSLYTGLYLGPRTTSLETEMSQRGVFKASAPLSRPSSRHENVGSPLTEKRNQLAMRNPWGSFGRSFPPFQSAPSPGAPTVAARFAQELSPASGLGQMLDLQLSDSYEDELLEVVDLPYMQDDVDAAVDRTEAQLANFDADRERPGGVTSDIGGHTADILDIDEDLAVILEQSNPVRKATSNTTVRRSTSRAAPITQSTAAVRKKAPAKKRKRPGKADRTIPFFERFVFLPEDDDGGRLEHISELPEKTALRLEASLDQLFQLDSERAWTVTRPVNSKTYLDSQVCIGVHLLSRDKTKLAPPMVSCPTCTGFAGVRPCVRLETDPEDSKTILVFYPRSSDRRSSEATWTEPRFWLGRGA